MKVLVTCPPMQLGLDDVRPLFDARGAEVVAPRVTQALSERELAELLPDCDGWILGDDPATRAVFSAGRRGRLRAAVKWGVGTDNVDFEAARAEGVPVAHTPGVFGGEVADVALGYLVALARGLFEIDRGVRDGTWPKPVGTSLAGRTAAVVGFGDVGRALARRLLACDLRVVAYDPDFAPQTGLEAVECARWPERIGEADFAVLCCALTPQNRHLLDAKTFAGMRRGVRLVNVARGALVDEVALVDALSDGVVAAAALDVFECEPLPTESRLRRFGHRVVFGSHNASNTREAVTRASRRAIELLFGLLDAGRGEESDGPQGEAACASPS